MQDHKNVGSQHVYKYSHALVRYRSIELASCTTNRVSNWEENKQPNESLQVDELVLMYSQSKSFVSISPFFSSRGMVAKNAIMRQTVH